MIFGTGREKLEGDFPSTVHSLLREREESILCTAGLENVIFHSGDNSENK